MAMAEAEPEAETLSICANCGLEFGDESTTDKITITNIDQKTEISVRTALSAIFSHSSSDEAEETENDERNEDDLFQCRQSAVIFCSACADSLTVLYSAYKSFMSICALDSEVSKLIQECDNLRRIKREGADQDTDADDLHLTNANANIKEEPFEDYEDIDGDGEGPDEADDANGDGDVKMEGDYDTRKGEGVEYPEDALEINLDCKSNTDFEKLPCEVDPEAGASTSTTATQSHPHSHSSPKKPRQRQRCPYCSFSSLQKTQLVNHISRDHAKTRVDCMQCADNKVYKSFACRSDLLMHIASVHMTQPQRYECEECGKIFPQERNFLIHQKTHEEERNNPSWKCELCDKSYRQEGRLLRHMKIDHGDDTAGYDVFRCEVCDTNFKDVGSLKRHLNRIHGPLTEEDTLRDKRVSRRKRSGRPKGIYPCSECPREFTHYGTLRGHIETVHRLVKKEIPLVVCEQCGKTLKGQANYKIHLMTHEDRAPDAGGICPHCSKGFTRRDTLRNHIRFVHNGVPWPKPKNGWPKKKSNSKRPRKKNQNQNQTEGGGVGELLPPPQPHPQQIQIQPHPSENQNQNQLPPNPTLQSVQSVPTEQQQQPMNITGNDGFYFFNL